jgi:hypothetical protein
MSSSSTKMQASVPARRYKSNDTVLALESFAGRRNFPLTPYVDNAAHLEIHARAA